MPNTGNVISLLLVTFAACASNGADEPESFFSAQLTLADSTTIEFEDTCLVAGGEPTHTRSISKLSEDYAIALVWVPSMVPSDGPHTMGPNGPIEAGVVRPTPGDPDSGEILTTEGSLTFSIRDVDAEVWAGTFEIVRTSWDSEDVGITGTGSFHCEPLFN